MDDALFVEVVERVVLGRAVVPDDDVAFVPAVPVGELGAGDLTQQEGQDRRRLLGREVGDVAGPDVVDEEQLLAGLGMGRE